MLHPKTNIRRSAFGVLLAMFTVSLVSACTTQPLSSEEARLRQRQTEERIERLDRISSRVSLTDYH